MSEQVVLEQLRTVKKQVEYLLERYPATRNNDTYLQLLWLKIFKRWPIPWIDYSKLGEANLENVRRNRQFVQNKEQRFPPTDPEVAKRRAKRERAIRQVIKRMT